jgi:hypothetical protein
VEPLAVLDVLDEGDDRSGAERWGRAGKSRDSQSLDRPCIIRTLRTALLQRFGDSALNRCFVRSFAGSRDAALAALRDDPTFYRRLDVYRRALAFQGLDPDRLSDEDALGLLIRDREDFARWREAGLDELALRPIGADPLATIKLLAPAA